jgi:Zn ribbon nucleic-acid-binding protein
MNIVSNCPLCEEKSLHVIGEEGTMQTQQCINCGYATTDRFIGKKEDNEMYKSLPEEMQSWAKEDNGRIWIPSMITLPFGTIYPIKIDNEMKWACAEMVDIPKEEQEKYPKEDGSGFHDKKYDTDNQQIFDNFIDAMADMNQKAKDNAVPEKNINLPKLTKLDG